MVVKFKYRKNEVVYFLANLFGISTSCIYKGPIKRLYWQSEWADDPFHNPSGNDNIPQYSISFGHGFYVTVSEGDIHRDYWSVLRCAKKKKKTLASRKVIKNLS